MDFSDRWRHRFNSRPLIDENTESPGQSALLARLHPILLMESPTYALFNAVEEGDVERVQQAMEAGANANPDDGRNAFQVRLSSANIEMEIRRYTFSLNIEKKEKNEFVKRIQYMSLMDNDLIWAQRIGILSEMEATDEQRSNSLDGIYMDQVCKYFIDEHPKLINKDTLIMFNTYGNTLPLLFYTVEEFDRKDLWKTIFKATKVQVLTDMFVDTFINKCINEQSLKILPMMVKNGIELHQKFKIQIVEPTDWSLYDQFTQRVVKTLNLTGCRIFPSMAVILEEMLKLGLRVNEPFASFEIFDEGWPSENVSKTLFNYLIMLRIRIRNKSSQIYNGNMEYYHMRKRGCFELESIENLKEKLDELLAVIFKYRPLHFTLLNNEMLSECLCSLNLQAKKESISKRWRKDLVLELVQRSQITPLKTSNTD